MKNKKIKLPGFLKKNLKKDKFEKNVLKRISKKNDIDFIKELFAVNKEGLVVLKRDPNKKELKRLKKLIKEIKGNKGFIKIGNLAFAAVLVAVTLVFAVFFKNPILENLAEKNLSSIFGAKCEISSLDLKIFGTSLSFKKMVVADKDNPYKNLFEMGRTNISLNTAQLFKAKFIAENIVCENLQFNTDRKKSGALDPADKKKKEKEKEEGEKKESSFPGLEKMDAKSVLEENKDKLKSSSIIEDVNKNISEMNDKWKANVEQGEKDVDKLKADVNEIKKINVKKLDLTKIQSTYKLIDGTISTSNSLYKKTAQATKEIKTDIKYATSQKKVISNAISKDFNYLKSLVKNEDGARSSLIADTSNQLVSNYLGALSGNALKAKNVLMKLKNSKAEDKPEKEKLVRRSGRSVYFPVKDYPEFLIEKFLFSKGTEEGKDLIYVSVENLTNNPDLIDKPVSVVFKSIDGTQKISVEGFIDVRTNRKEDVNLTVKLENLSITLNDLDGLNIEELKARYDVDSDFIMARDNDISGKMNTFLTNTEIKPGSKTDFLSKTIVDLIGGLEQIRLDTSYEIRDGSLKLKTSSNADKELVNIAGKIARQNAAEYEAALKKELYASLEDSLGENNELVKQLEGMGSLSDANLKDVSSYKDQVKNKRKEVEKAATDAAAEAAKDKIKDLGKDLKLPF